MSFRKVDPASGSKPPGAPRDDSMAQVPKLQIGKQENLEFDVFVRMGPHRYLQIARKGTISQIQQLRVYCSDLVAYFYIPKGDFDIYVCNQITGLDSVLSGKVSVQQALLVVGHAVDAVLESIRISGFRPFAWDGTIQVARALQAIASFRPKVTEIFHHLQEFDGVLAKHSMFVTLLSLLIAGEIGKLPEQEVSWVGQAGLLHDMGLIGASFCDPNHPLIAAEWLRKVGGIPPEVCTLVEEHHENILGTGSPKGLKAPRIHLRTSCLALAERFAELTLGDSFHQDFLSFQAAFNTIGNVEGHPYPEEVLKALEKLVKEGTKT